MVVNRRWFGVLVLVGVLFVAVLGTDPLTRRVAGDPAVVTVPGAPVIGDCVVALTTTERGMELEQTVNYPTADYGRCDGPIVGEVSSVDGGLLPAERITGADYWPLSAQCALDGIGYTGSIPPVVNQGAGRPGILWIPSASLAFTPIGPNPTQRALGQHWSACVVGSDDTRPYVGRLHRALSSGALPAVFGSCWPTSNFSTASEISCDRPHVVEVLGTTSVGMDPVAVTDLRAACITYAGRVLRTADPTRQGAVSMDIVGDDRAFAGLPSATYLPAAQVQDARVSCYAQAGEGSLFDGTLVGIGDGPLPLVR